MHEVENVTTVPSCWFRHFYARRLPERSGRPSSSRRLGEGAGEAVRKIVTAKDFEFSPRKESAAAEPASSPSLACACIMHAQRRCEKNVLAAAKRGMVALSPCMRRYQPGIRYAGVHVLIPGGPDTLNFDGGFLITLINKILLIVTSIMNDVNGDWQHSV